MPDAAIDDQKPPSGASRVWERFKKARGAQTGLRLVVLFTLAAFLAPLVAHRLPFVWRDGETGAVSWPLVREFFAPSDTTEPALERGINFLFLYIPLAYAAWRILNRHWPSLARRESRAISLLFGALAALSLWTAIGGMIVDGGGRDWLHYEQPPVPEMDDILDPSAFRTGAPPDGVSSDNQDALRRAIIGEIQKTIEGPALPVPDGGLARFAQAGLDRDKLTTPLDQARWNRIALEETHPGLLAPMRRFRGTFVAMAVLSVLVLLGLTVICLAGAWQFALSPRWLVLLALAAALAPAFRLPARHDHTPYRALHDGGKGWGVFPPIPYGPNEQGFGPRLPPSWFAESPLYGEGAIAAIADTARAREQPFWGESPNAFIQSPEDDPKGLLARAGVAVDRNLEPYTAKIDSGAALSPLEMMRFKRLLLDRLLADAVAPANASRWKKPSNAPGWHCLGTDESGRDVLVRIIHGARVSLSVGFVSVFLATVIGLVTGSLAAYYGGRVDMLISRFLEIMMCFPSFFLILAVIAVLDRRSIVNIMLVIGLTSWTGVARLIRGEMLRQKKMEYVAASIALGASDTRTIFRHILPNAMAPVLVSISFGITGAILTEAGLSFIGFGVTPPTPTWGQLLSETRDSPLANWWLAVFPGIVLFISVLAYNFVGEALRDALDPRTAA